MRVLGQNSSYLLHVDLLTCGPITFVFGPARSRRFWSGPMLRCRGVMLFLRAFLRSGSGSLAQVTSLFGAAIGFFSAVLIFRYETPMG